MYTSAILTSLLTLSAITTAAPVRRDDTLYHGISISVITSSGTDPVKHSSPAPVQINVLTKCMSDATNPCSASSLIIDPNDYSNVNINAVECRAYKDFEGQVPGSAPFNVTKPALLSTNLVDIGAILCYIVAQ